ncbi:EF hand domain-containing protein [Stella humosa]|uniref:EF hand domain-containing protein n=2 Tax=Stella humosa TaxID=94 RepID=A0A3N1MAM9_9PROT|nr:EF hand domain-containing protein [Stella humosa]
MRSGMLAVVLTMIGMGAASAADGQALRQMFRQADRNGDRALQFTEIQAARAALFDRMDTNGNGLLESTEVEAARGMQQGRRIPAASLEDLAAQAARMDRNGDGRIAREEFALFIPERLLRADANGDRSLSLAELRALRRQ